MKKLVTINTVEKRGRQRLNLRKLEEDISRKDDEVPGDATGEELDCTPNEDGEYTIVDCSDLLNDEGVLYAWEPPEQDVPAVVVVQWNFNVTGSSLDDSGTWGFGPNANVAGGFNRLKALQPGAGSEPIPIADDEIQYQIEGSIANWFGDPSNPSYEAPRYLYAQWRHDNTVLQEILIATSVGNRTWVHGIEDSVPPAGTNNIRFRVPLANSAWDAVAVSYEPPPSGDEDNASSLIPPTLSRVYNQLAIRVDGDTYNLCINARRIFEVKIDGVPISGWSFDGNKTITLPTWVSSDTEVWVRFLA